MWTVVGWIGKTGILRVVRERFPRNQGDSVCLKPQKRQNLGSIGVRWSGAGAAGKEIRIRTSPEVERRPYGEEERSKDRIGTTEDKRGFTFCSDLEPGTHFPFLQSHNQALPPTLSGSSWGTGTRGHPTPSLQEQSLMPIRKRYEFGVESEPGKLGERRTVGKNTVAVPPFRFTRGNPSTNPTVQTRGGTGRRTDTPQGL